jgi:hypothetical protein
MSRLNLSGNRYEKLSVTGPVLPMAYGRGARQFWECRCDCGNTTRVEQSKLRSGHTRSCGCLSIESVRKRRLTHGFTVNRTPTPEYRIWLTMNTRCNNPRATGFDNYGGRGIVVCQRWRQFPNFLADMGPRPSSKHSIDRIDNDGPYDPTNCRWVTRTEQARNTRANHLVNYLGRTQCLAEWADDLGVPESRLRHRLRHGWSVHDALMTPKTNKHFRSKHLSAC